MEITRTSMLSGITRTRNLPITQAQIDEYNRGALLQNAFPNASADEREFFKTGIVQEEWDTLVEPEELEE